MEAVTFHAGEEDVVEFRDPDAKHFAQAFCRHCGSAAPRLDPSRGVAVVPLGILDDDPGQQPDDHIFTGSKAGWYTITDQIPAFERYPE